MLGERVAGEGGGWSECNSLVTLKTASKLSAAETRVFRSRQSIVKPLVMLHEALYDEHTVLYTCYLWAYAAAMLRKHTLATSASNIRTAQRTFGAATCACWTCASGGLLPSSCKPELRTRLTLKRALRLGEQRQSSCAERRTKD